MTGVADRADGIAVAPAADVPAALLPVALYIHVPFCVSLCPYCDFVVYAGAAARGAKSRLDAFVSALLTELDLRARAADEAFGPRGPLRSVYLGGGTPSLLSKEALAAILGRVQERFGIAVDAEVTLEANPGPTERGDLEAAAAAGVTRVSFGAQSFDEEELRRLGRRHRPADVAAAVVQARAAGIGSVSIDLLYDVPGQTLESWGRSLEAALALKPDHLSLYALTLDDPAAEGLTGPTGDHLPTPSGARRWRERARGDQDEDRAAAQYTHATHRLAAGGWRGYEISNWARPGHESRHNQAYWQRLPYEAVGPGAHAFDGRHRRWNAARLDAWAAALEQGRFPPGGSEEIDDDTAAAEEVVLALRTDRGIPAAAGKAPRFREPMDWAIAIGLVTPDGDGRIRLTTRGRLLSNELFARLV
jgi:putative oxygen-independent coproporphyrinogen III oxidase